MTTALGPLVGTGRSPRVRGTRREGRRRDDQNWFIPARAGNAISIVVSRVHPTVHPRACGERARDQVQAAIGAGSSPRVRGTRSLAAIGLGVARFIPARAGNASPARTRRPERPVHPRACGERWMTPRMPAAFTGSSPRVRGTLRRNNETLHPRRFIPARAGNAFHQV